jgi:hypothetical protein
VEERIIRADPVEEPQAYQDELLALLGGQDPVEVMAATAAVLREAVDGLDADQLARPPAQGEWSVEQVIAHLFDAQLAYAFRARMILAHDGPPLVGYDQEAWAALPHPSAAVMVELFGAMRDADVDLIRRTPAEDWDRAGIHEERGPTTFRLLVETIAGHDRAHLEQLRRTAAAARR